MTRAACKDGYSALFKETDDFIPHIIRSYGLHWGRGEHFGGNAFGLDEHLEGEGVDNGREHAHAVAVNAVEALVYTLEAAENVAAAVDEADLETGFGGVGDLFSDGREARGVEAFAGVAAEAFSAYLK